MEIRERNTGKGGGRTEHGERSMKNVARSKMNGNGTEGKNNGQRSTKNGERRKAQVGWSTKYGARRKEHEKGYP